MRRAYFACLFQFFAGTFLLSQSNPVPLVNHMASVASPTKASQADPKAQARVLDSYGKLPLSFEANHGQTDARVKFLSRTSGYSLFLTGDEAVLAMSRSKANTHKTKIAGAPQTLHSDMVQPKAGGVLRMKLRNANPLAKVSGMDELAGTSNYFIGNDPTKWRTNVPTYAKVKYEGIYSGIDLVYYGNQRQLEYDFIVAPGADPRRIAFDMRGAKRIRQDSHGDLVLKMEAGENEIRWHKPVVYQEKDGARQLVVARYAVTDKNRVGFEVAKYDVGRALYIDPLIYSTYLGGSSYEFGNAIAVDSAGNAYVAGRTGSTDFPVTAGGFQTICNAGCVNGTGFVAKLNVTGSAFIYSTYLGGSGGEGAWGIAVDSSGNAYVTGNTYSTDFPTVNPLQPANGGVPDGFVTKLNPTGSALVYSTYLGGIGYDEAYGIAVDGAGNAYVTGITGSTDFPTMNPLQPALGGGFYDAFVSKLNPMGSALVYSTYWGGNGQDGGNGIAIDSEGSAYVSGSTVSTDFPTTPGAFQTVCDGCANYYGDAFVSKFSPTGMGLVYSTYLGGSGIDSGGGIALDRADNAYITGTTDSTDFPTTPGAFQTVCAAVGCYSGNAFIAKLNPMGSALVYSTYLGGKGGAAGIGIAVDRFGNAHVTGSTRSYNFPRKNPVQKEKGGLLDAFVSRFNPAGSALIYSTYLGGNGYDQGAAIAVDSAGNAYVTGYTGSTNFPTVNPLQAGESGPTDAFIAKIHITAASKTTLTSSPNPSAYGQAVTLTAVVSSSIGAPPDGETVSFMKGKKVLGTGALSGGSASFTTSALPVGTDYIKAVYSGDGNFAGSKSNTAKQVVH